MDMNTFAGCNLKYENGDGRLCYFTLHWSIIIVTYFLLNWISRLPQPTDHDIELCVWWLPFALRSCKVRIQSLRLTFTRFPHVLVHFSFTNIVVILTKSPGPCGTASNSLSSM